MAPSRPEEFLKDSWNPGQYEAFEKERDQPFFDLLGGLPTLKGKTAVDLGCGTGKLTWQMHRRLGLASTVGRDNSPSMLKKARALTERGLMFEEGSVEGFAPAKPFDLVYSNAALQWVEDHEALLEKLYRWTAPTGWLAVQMPANHDHPSHVTAAQVAGESPFREALEGHTRRSPVRPPEWYAEALARAGFAEPVVILKVYLHRLPSRDGVVEWAKGTMLTDYERRMPSELWPRFLARYRECLLPQLREESPYLYPFKRILFWACRSP